MIYTEAITLLMRGAILFLGGWASAAAMLVACGAFSPANEDGNDAGTLEAGSRDAIATSDVDGTDALDAATCSGFCDDFEHDNLGARWDQVDTADGGAIGTHGAAANSGNRGLRVDIAPNALSAWAYVVKRSSAPVTRVSIDFWMRIYASARIVQVLSLGLAGQGNTMTFLGLHTSGAGTVSGLEHVFDGSNFVNSRELALSDLPRMDQWQHWHVEVDAAEAPARARVLVDGVIAFEEPLVNAFAPGAAVVQLGASYVQPEGPVLTVDYDDVVIQLR